MRCFQDSHRVLPPDRGRRDPDGPGMTATWVATGTAQPPLGLPPSLPAPRPTQAPGTDPATRHGGPGASGTSAPSGPGTDRSRQAVTARPLEGQAVYMVQVVTGDRKKAGTSASVFLELHGVEGASGEHALDPRPGATPPFQRASTSAFKIRCQALGPLKSVASVEGPRKAGTCGMRRAGAWGCGRGCCSGRRPGACREASPR